MNYIITGANGYIGSNLINFLAHNNNNRIYAFVKDSSCDIKKILHNNVKVFYCDLADISNFDETLIDIKIDVFYNFAWFGVSTKFKNDFDIQVLNILYSYNCINLCEKINCKKYIGIGSVSEFAYANGKITGNETPMPSDFYSAAKISARYFCNLFAKQNNIDFNYVFISSVYGPGRDDGNLITYTIKALLRHETPSYTKLEQVWDYIYIDDLINALYLIGIYGVNYKLYVVGNGKSIILKDAVDIIKNKINQSAVLNIGALPYKTDKIDNCEVDISDLIKDTGFTPFVTFEEGISKTISYFSKEKIND